MRFQALTIGRMMPRSLSPSRTLRALGAAALLMSVAGCSSSDETAQQQEHQADGISANSEQAEASGSSESSARPEDIDYRTILDGITYKGQPVVVRSPEQIEEFIQMSRDAQEQDSDENMQVEPPECEQDFRIVFDSYNADKMTVDNFSMADLDTDSLTIFAEAAELADVRGTDLQLDPENCASFTADMHGYSQEVTVDHVPFEGDADNGVASVIHSVFDDGIEAKLYSVIAEKGDAYVNIVIKDDSEESIQAVNETLDQILERL